MFHQYKMLQNSTNESLRLGLDVFFYNKALVVQTKISK